MDESVPEEPEESDEPDGAAGSVSEEPLPLLSDPFGLSAVQLCVGTLSSAKYSVLEGQLLVARSPVVVHIDFCTTEVGIVKSL